MLLSVLRTQEKSYRENPDAVLWWLSCLDKIKTYIHPLKKDEVIVYKSISQFLLRMVKDGFQIKKSLRGSIYEVAKRDILLSQTHYINPLASKTCP